MDTNNTILVKCDDSACASFESGHEVFASIDTTDVIHGLEPIIGWNYTLTVQRGAWAKEWTVEVDINTDDADFTTNNAVNLAADLLRASTECRTLNESPELATIQKVLTFATDSGVSLDSLTTQEILDHIAA